MKIDPSNVRVLNLPRESFFLAWVNLLSPFINITKSEKKAFAAILKQRYKYSLTCSDSNLVDVLTLSTESRVIIKEELGINDRAFYNTLSILKKKKIINRDNKIGRAHV